MSRSSSRLDAVVPTRFSRRGLLAGAAGLGATLGLSACGAPGGAGAKARQAAISIPGEFRNRTPVLFWAPFTGVNYTAVQARLEAFNRSQNDIVAVAESQGSYASLNQKLIAGLQARAVPDIVCFPEFQWLQFFFADAFVELDQYFDADWSLDVYLQNYVNEGRAAGRTFLVPFARSTPLFYFNRQRYREAGLPEEGPKTWDELASFAPELAKIQVNGRPLKAHAFSSDDSWYAQAMSWAWDGNLSRDFQVTLNEAPGLEWMQWQREFIHRDGFGYLAQSPMTDLTTEVSAGSHGSTASLKNTTDKAKFDLGVAFMMNQKAEQMHVPTGGGGLAIVRAESKERQDAAAELFRFLAEPEQSALWHRDTGYVPIVQKARDTSIVKDLVAADPNYGVSLAQLPRARTADRTNWFQTNVTTLGTSLAQVWGDDADPKTVLDRATAKLQKELDDNRENLQEVLG